MSDLGITGIFHANINVRNMDASIKWYTEVLGATLRMGPYDDEGPNIRAVSFGSEAFGVHPDEIKIRYALLGWGEGPNETLLDLIEAVNPPTWGEVYPNAMKVGLNRLCLATEGVESAYAKLQERGVKILTPLVTFASDGFDEDKCCFCFEDPDGAVLELFGTR
ncbi:VOC family protein [Aeromicrobium endophyticum]|uniref:VOC domain-containing protein n=1 Tax=Aeromicrobium endophyticum TaxID=2292704 RepID=A0A371PAG1_9ACTN|nr:VOC family protein [Aeromicrobium endophyticum]REK72901.1 hypothetical protein DX116_04710 [Aeromicrobium endophyticum]